jgi:hypothetical protein
MTRVARRRLDSEERQYWLRNCHGFRVYSADRKLGIVDDVLYGAEPGVPSALAVRTGLFRLGLQVVPIEEVDEVDPKNHRITLVERLQ